VAQGQSLTWIDACVAATPRIADVATAALLDAFAVPHPRGGPPAPAERPWSADFAALARDTTMPAREQVAASLREDVDAAQAELFVRRVLAVDDFLGARDQVEARVLQVGLRHRLAGILAAARPHASRVRALADFYSSIGCRLAHRHLAGARARHDALASLRWHTIGDGLARAELGGDFREGPTHVNLLRVDPRRVRIDAVDCREDVARGLAFADTVARAGALAATSGGFFLYSEPDIEPPSQRHDPVGLVVADGEVVTPPVFGRGALVIAADGRARIDRVTAVGATLTDARGVVHTVATVHNRAHGRIGPDRDAIAIVGDRVLARGRHLAVPLLGAVVTTREPLALEPGDTVRWRLPGAVRTAMAGGPCLRLADQPLLDLRAEDFWDSAPPITFSQDETGDLNLLPRLAVGLCGDTLVFAAVDGRNFERALGMTLSEVGALLGALGCTEVVNLDGGSSKRMVVDGRTLDLPSTEITGEGPADPSVRPVYTALFMHAR
jgi:hypothetical protein